MGDFDLGEEIYEFCACLWRILWFEIRGWLWTFALTALVAAIFLVAGLFQ